MGDRYDISVDIGEGKDKGVQCWIRIGDDGKYIPATVIDTTTTISLADSVQRSGYASVEAGELCNMGVLGLGKYKFVRRYNYGKVHQVIRWMVS